MSGRNRISSKETMVTSVATVAAIAITMNILRPAIMNLTSRWYLEYLAKKKKKEISSSSSSSSEPEGTVSGLFVHPVKSMRAVSLEQVEMDEKGFVNDRRFMVVYPIPKPAWKDQWDLNVDSTHRFLTQRQCPSLATIVATIENNNNDTNTNTTTLVLTWKDKSIRIPIDSNKTTTTTNSSKRTSFLAGIWDDQVQVEDMGDDAAAFVQEIVNADIQNCQAGDEGDQDASTNLTNMYQNIRLVSHTANDRPTDANFTPASAWQISLFDLLFSSLSSSKKKKNYLPSVALTDGYPILIACQTSLDELNRRLKEEHEKNQDSSSSAFEPIPMSRFRPNIVISGTKVPFEEDLWKTIIIGDQQFAIVKACPRCKQSCTDQETGKVTSEPVNVMKSFRALGKDSKGNTTADVYFAQNAIPIGTTTTATRGGVGRKNTVLRVGDSVQVLQTGEPVYC